jgi:hypothetical protein
MPSSSKKLDACEKYVTSISISAELAVSFPCYLGALFSPANGRDMLL